MWGGIDPFVPNPPAWSAIRIPDYGYTEMTVHNKTHISCQQVSSDKVMSYSWVNGQKISWLLAQALKNLIDFDLLENHWLLALTVGQRVKCGSILGINKLISI